MPDDLRSNEQGKGKKENNTGMILTFIADARSIHTQRWATHFAQKGHEIHLIIYYLMTHTIHGVTDHVITSRWKNHFLSFIPHHIAIKRLIKKWV
jgi:hypothetical protein